MLIGFGLYFSYLRNMLWSGLGFNFLIVAGVLQFYPLINGFWTKANVQTASTDWSDTYIQIYLSD